MSGYMQKEYKLPDGRTVTADFNELGCAMVTIQAMDALFDILNSSEQQWTPCSERLPMTKDDYIITVKDKSLTWTDYVEWSADYHWWEYDDDMVIAWMPLPEPYKGEKA